MKSSIKKLFVLATTAFLPVISFAQVIVTTTQSNQASNPVFRLLDLFLRILKVAAPTLIAILVVIIIVKVIQFAVSEETAKEGLKGILLKLLLALFFVLTLFGLVHLVSNVLGVGVGGTVTTQMVPQVEVPMY